MLAADADLSRAQHSRLLEPGFCDGYFFVCDIAGQCFTESRRAGLCNRKYEQHAGGAHERGKRMPEAP